MSSRGESRASQGSARSVPASPAKSTSRRSRPSDLGVVDSALSSGDGSRRPSTAGERPEGERVKVFVRVRPTKAEGETPGSLRIKDDGAGVLIHRGHGTSPNTDFEFDRVLPPSASQSDVYQAAVRPIVEDVLRGYNGTVMAYGQTGTGKTFTLSSIQPSAIGMVPRALAEVFSAVAADPAHEYTVVMSYIQIYMELIQDLLRPESENLQIRENERGGVFVGGVAQREVTTIEQCLALLQQGDRNRTTAFTALNASSSRSHAVLMLTVVKRKLVAGTAGVAEIARVKVGKLFMVDLAGSERLKKSKSTGLRATEAKSINLSLTTLGMCINARADPAATHVPFRDSKLTRLLQDSLGGNARTSLIVACCDAAEHVDETLQSLHFGSRAMCVRTAAVVNESVDYRSQDAEVLAALDQRSALLERSLLAKESELEAVQAALKAEQLGSMRVIEALKQEREEAEASQEHTLREQRAVLEAEQQQKAALEAQLQESSLAAQGAAEQHQQERRQLLSELSTRQQELEAARQAAEATAAQHAQQVEALQLELAEERERLAAAAAEERQRLEGQQEAARLAGREELAVVQRQLLGSREEVRILQAHHEQAMEEAQTAAAEKLQAAEAAWAAKLRAVEAAVERQAAAGRAEVAKREAKIAELQEQVERRDGSIAALGKKITGLEAQKQQLEGRLAQVHEAATVLQQQKQQMEAKLSAELRQAAGFQAQIDAYERSRLNLAHSFFEHKRVSDAARVIQRHYRDHRMRRLRRQQTEGYAALSEAKTALGSLAAQHAELEAKRRANLAFSGQTLVGDSLGVLQEAVEGLVAAFLLPARDLRSVQRYNQKMAGAAAGYGGGGGNLSARSTATTASGDGSGVMALGGSVGTLPPSLLQRTSTNTDLIRAVNPLGGQSTAVSHLGLAGLHLSAGGGACEVKRPPMVPPLGLPPQLAASMAASAPPAEGSARSGLAGLGRMMSFNGRSPFKPQPRAGGG